MKKILLVLLLLLTLCACNKKEEKEEVVYETPNIIIADDEKEVTEEEKIEVTDLTFMSGTVLYSEVYNMMNSPQDYENQRIRLKGLFATGQDMNNELMFGCLVPDAALCCAQGIPFVLANKDKLVYPQDYPNLGDEIIVEGDFFYEIGENYIIVRLDNATLDTLNN